MKIEFNHNSYRYITDNTNELDEDTILLKTHQNEKYLKELKSDTKIVLPDELMHIWGLFDLQVVGITGTNGKTTTAAAIYSILLDLGKNPALQGTRGLFANEKRLEEKSLTTPSVLHTLYNMKLAKDEGCDIFVMEVSSHGIEQRRIESIEFALKVHTNVTSDHLDYHGSVEEYRRVKGLFFADESPKLLNKDEIANITYNPKNAQTYGVDEPATYKVQAFSLKDGISAYIKHFGEEATFHSPMQGLFNLYNLTAAVASVSMLSDIPLVDICETLKNFGGVAGRMEVVNKDPLIIVDFAHTDDGMLKVLDAMRDKEMVVVFGAGGNRDKLKRPRMGMVAGRYAKKIFVTSDNPRDEVPEMILEEILQGLRGKDNVTATPDRRVAIELAIDSLEPNEILLVLGKGDERYQEVKGKKIPFDDREIIKEILSKRSCKKH